MNKIDIDMTISLPLWNELDFDPANIADKIVPATLVHSRIPTALQEKELELSIVLTKNQEIQTLNQDYRAKNKPTNILSFASIDDKEWETEIIPDRPFSIGDIILAYETIKDEAKAQDKSMKAHYMHLLVHGILHLMGYDHQDDKEADIMEKLEIKILKEFGIENPYFES